MTKPPAESRKPGHGDRLIPRLIGGPLREVMRVLVQVDEPADSLAARSLALSPNDHSFLGLLAREPWLATAELAAILDWPPQKVRLHRSRLVRLGLLCRLELAEIGDREERSLVEATLDGLRMVAAHEGLSLARAVEHLGLTGGGREHAIGSRGALLRRFKHTRGLAIVLADLYRSASVLRARGEDDRVVEWRNAQAAARRSVRPDGHVAYRHRGHVYGAFVEYDRATMRLRDYRKKLLAYAEHLERDRHSRDYVGFPTILFLTLNAQAEERIVTTARLNQVESRLSLPILVTHLWRPGEDPTGPRGLLGPIWRKVGWEGDRRDYWLLP